jgi:hypothetical protein
LDIRAIEMNKVKILILISVGLLLLAVVQINTGIFSVRGNNVDCASSSNKVVFKNGSSGNLVRGFGAEGELSTAKEDAITVVFKASKASG